MPRETKVTPTRWSWQETYAEVDPKGDLKWKPRPFVFEKGDSVRYIDFETGDDANSGAVPATPWKHHPWDPNATGKSAKSASTREVHTYIFKRGVLYREPFNGALAHGASCGKRWAYFPRLRSFSKACLGTSK